MKTKTNTEMAIKPGSTLLTEKPFVFVLKSKLRLLRCDYCFKRTRVLRCSGCQYIYYCGHECQKLSWHDHKYECSNLRKVSPRVVPDAARLMAKIIIKLQKGGDLVKGYYTKNNYRTFKDLMSHYSDMKHDTQRMDHFTSLFAVLIDFVGECNLPNSAELMGIYGRMCVNGFNILDGEMLSIGTGIYLGASVIDHSCDPNAVAVFQGTTLHIRAVKDMPVLDWTKVRISYIELLNTRHVRQNELKDAYYFICDCSRCQDIEELRLMDSLQCPKTGCTTPFVNHDVSETVQQCQTCGHHIKADLIKEYEEVLQFTIHQLELMRDVAYLDVCKVCLGKQRGLFHPLNLWQIKILDLAFESSIEMGQWHLAQSLGLQLQQGYSHYYAHYHPLHGIFHLKLGKIHLFMLHTEPALMQLQEAERILRVTHGEEHALYREELMPLLEQASHC